MLLALLVTSCAGAGMQLFDEIMMSKARTKAAFDLQCPQESLAVTKIDNGAYGVRGCEQQVTYIGKDPHFCLPVQSESTLREYCQVVPDTLVKGWK